MGTAIDVQGWKLRDRANHVFQLAGTIGAISDWVITLPSGRLPLTNSGDSIELLDDNNNLMHLVTYTAADVEVGVEIAFQ